MIDIQRDTEGELYTIKVKGDVDASSSIHLDNSIKASVQEGAKKIIVDCSNLEYISSAGLGVFMSYLEEFKANKVRIVLFGLNPKVYNVFQILGLDQLMNIVESHGDAINYINEI